MIRLNSVLVATDFGETSDVALTYGRSLSRGLGAKLHVLHIAENVAATAAAEYYPALVVDLQKDVEEAARKRLDALLTAEDRAGGATAVVRVAVAPATAIVDYAKEAKIDLIIVGTHGRGAVARVFMGSVAERVVRTAPCPVLTVRPNERDFVVPEPAKGATGSR